MAAAHSLVQEFLTVTIDDRSLNAVILPALERCLLEIASERACAAEELSFSVYRALEKYGIECIRAAEQAPKDKDPLAQSNGNAKKSRPPRPRREARK